MIQNEWMTSRDWSLILTVSSTGRYSVGSSLIDAALGIGLRLDAHRPDGVIVGVAVVLEVPRPLLADRRDRDVGVVVLRLEDRSGRAP